MRCTDLTINRALLAGVFCAALSWGQSPALSGIAHVAFRVGDIEAAREFYRKLGFEQAFEFTKAEKTYEAFFKVNDRQFIELYPRSEDTQPLGLMHVCYEASDLEAVSSEYVKRGVKPPALRKGSAGNFLFSLRDPEDAVIEYTQYLPGSRHSEDRGKHLGEQRVSQQLVGAAFPVRDLAAERAFYTGGLGFEALGRGDPARLRVPGGSGHEVELTPAGERAKPGLKFAVADLRRVADELRNRGLTVKTSPTAVTVTDPDGVTISFAARAGLAQQDYFANWPAGTSPQEVGKRVAERFVVSPHPNPKRIIYPEVCTWYGALTFAQLAAEKDLSARVIKRFDSLMTPQEAGLIQKDRHVDFTVFGTVPLEIYIQTKEPKYLELGKFFADRQWEDPTPEGLTSETRFWIDDMFMITAVQVQAFRATGEAKYLDRAALEMVAYLDKLQQPNGLFYHALDVPFFWGRGNGWVAAGMTELLRSLPKDHPRRARVLEGYRKMMKALLEFQGQDGMWRQLIDHPEAWPETSSTGMYTFAMITGVKNEWLDAAAYGPAARNGWLALVGYIDQNADVTSVCEGTNKKNDLAYYLARARRTGDFHGQAPVLWCASALLR